MGSHTFTTSTDTDTQQQHYLVRGASTFAGTTIIGMSLYL